MDAESWSFIVQSLLPVLAVCPGIIVTGRERIQCAWNPWQGSGEPGPGPLLPGFDNSSIIISTDLSLFVAMSMRPRLSRH